MASSSSRGPRCRERSRRGRAGRGSVPRGRSRSRSPVRDGESRAFQELSPLRDPDGLAHSEDRGESTKSQLKTTQKPKDQNDPCGANGQAPVGTEAQGEPSVTSENGSVPPRKAPGKRGRKPKAEMLLLKLSQDLECPAPQPLCLQKVLGSDEAEDGPETPPGGRPKRRAAKVALLYLQQLAEELSSVCQPPAPTEGAQEPAPELERVQKKRRGRRKKEKEETDSDDPAGDADFVPSKEVLLQAEEEEGSDAPLSEMSEPELEVLRGQGGKTSPTGRSKPLCRGLAPNGFHNSVMAPVEKCSSLTCSLRDQQHSQWEFPDWIPLAHKWTCLSDSEAAPYLPAEEKSPLFSIQREGIEDNGVLYRVNRFNSLQPHAERLDVSFFVGGPVWAMEWCPSPEGSAAAQYVAIYCHGSMEETHSAAGLHGGPMLLQLWGLGTLQQEQGSADKAALAYAIATDHGCVWDMKFCPSGAWEPPDAARQHPQMSRLGLLAVAFSDGKVVLYALPHPGALHRAKRAQMGPSTSTLSARCSAWPRSRWAPSRPGTCPSAGSASASPGCRPSPIITSQRVFMMAPWPSGTCSPSPCCSACASLTAPSSSTRSSASQPTTTRCGASSGARLTATSWSRQGTTARSSSGTCGGSTSPSTASSGSSAPRWPGCCPTTASQWPRTTAVPPTGSAGSTTSTPGTWASRHILWPLARGPCGAFLAQTG